MAWPPSKPFPVPALPTGRYIITDRGREILNAWLTSELDHQPERNAFLARLFFSGALADSQLRELLAARRAAVESLLETLTDMRFSMPEPTDRWARMRRATLDNGIAHVHTELNWLSALQEELT